MQLGSFGWLGLVARLVGNGGRASSGRLSMSACFDIKVAVTLTGMFSPYDLTRIVTHRQRTMRTRPNGIVSFMKPVHKFMQMYARRPVNEIRWN